MHQRVGRDPDPDRERKRQHGEHLVGLLVGEGQPAPVAGGQHAQRGKDRAHRGLRNPGDRIDESIGGRVPPHHLEAFEELQQHDVELGVDGRDREPDGERETGHQQASHQRRLQLDVDRLVPPPANDGEGKEAGKQVARGIDPDEHVPARVPEDRQAGQAQQHQGLDHDGERFVAEPASDVEHRPQQAGVTRRQ